MRGADREPRAQRAKPGGRGVDREHGRGRAHAGAGGGLDHDPATRLGRDAARPGALEDRRRPASSTAARSAQREPRRLHGRRRPASRRRRERAASRSGAQPRRRRPRVLGGRSRADRRRARPAPRRRPGRGWSRPSGDRRGDSRCRLRARAQSPIASTDSAAAARRPRSAARSPNCSQSRSSPVPEAVDEAGVAAARAGAAGRRLEHHDPRLRARARSAPRRSRARRSRRRRSTTSARASAAIGGWASTGPALGEPASGAVVPEARCQ